MVALWRLLWLRDDPPVGVHLVVRQSLVAKANVFSVGSEDEELLITDSLEGFLVEGHGSWMIIRMDAHLGVVDHVGAGWKCERKVP